MLSVGPAMYASGWLASAGSAMFHTRSDPSGTPRDDNLGRRDRPRDEFVRQLRRVADKDDRSRQPALIEGRVEGGDDTAGYVAVPSLRQIDRRHRLVVGVRHLLVVRRFKIGQRIDNAVGGLVFGPVPT